MNSNGWKAVTLGDVINLKRGYDLRTSARKPGDIPVVSSSGVTGSHNEAKVQAPGVVTGRYGTLGEIYFLAEDFWPLNTTLYVEDFKGNDPKFVYYFLQTLELEHYNDKSSVPGINRNHVHTLEVTVPPLSEQRGIAGVLSRFDEKIELNRQMNETLEAMARAIFKSWFVDFDPVHAKARGEAPAGMDDAIAELFPEGFVESDLGPIPEGWEPVKMKALVSLDHNRLTPQDHAEEIFDYFSIPAYKESGMPEVEVGAEIKSSKYLVPEGCVLLSRLNPRFPRVWLPVLQGEHRAICSTEFLIAMPKAGISREYLYTLFNMDNFRLRFENLVTGTSGSHQRVKQGSFLDMWVVKPPQPMVEAFTRIAQPIYEKIAQNRLESRTLAELRDTLLPKLISGELRVPEQIRQD